MQVKTSVFVAVAQISVAHKIVQPALRHKSSRRSEHIASYLGRNRSQSLIASRSIVTDCHFRSQTKYKFSNQSRYDTSLPERFELTMKTNRRWGRAQTNAIKNNSH